MEFLEQVVDWNSGKKSPSDCWNHYFGLGLCWQWALVGVALWYHKERSSENNREGEGHVHNQFCHPPLMMWEASNQSVEWQSCTVYHNRCYKIELLVILGWNHTYHVLKRINCRNIAKAGYDKSRKQVEMIQQMWFMIRKDYHPAEEYQIVGIIDLWKSRHCVRVIQ